jgi:hypothetical protein
MASILSTGSVVLLGYVGEDMFHERLVIGYVAGSEYVVVTPDFDIFVEQLDLANADLSAIRFPTTGGGLPIGIQAGGIYQFAQMSAGEKSALLEEGGRYARVERAQRGLPELVESQVAVGGIAMVIPVRGALAPSGTIAPRIVPPGGGWIVDEPTKHHDLGDAVAVPPGTSVILNRAMILLQGEAVAVRFVEAGVDVEKYVSKRGGFLADDERTLEVLPSREEGAFAEIVGEMVEVPALKFPIEGGRTGAWFVEKVKALSPGGFMVRHHRWAKESGIKGGDRSRFEHNVISRTLDAAVSVDRLNVKNLLFAEILLRRKQLIEEAVAENPEAPNFEGAEYYMGSEERPGGALVSPALKLFVAGKFSAEAAILKEKRKAREAKKGK